jgi:hypothetical protein
MWLLPLAVLVVLGILDFGDKEDNNPRFQTRVLDRPLTTNQNFNAD